MVSFNSEHDWFKMYFIQQLIILNIYVGEIIINNIKYKLKSTGNIWLPMNW